MSKMNPENFESRMYGRNLSGPIVFRTNGRELWVGVEGDDGRALTAYLTVAQVHELKAMIANWEKLYYDGCFQE